MSDSDRVRIDQTGIEFTLGDVFYDQNDDTWLFIGRRRATTGWSFRFIKCDGTDWVYECQFYDTLCRKFNNVKVIPL